MRRMRRAMRANQQNAATALAKAFEFANAGCLNIANNVFVMNQVAKHADRLAACGKLHGNFYCPTHTKTKTRRFCDLNAQFFFHCRIL